MKYPHLASMVFNTPLLIHPLKLDAILGGVGSRLLGAPLMIAASPAIADTGAVKPEMFSTRRGERTDRGYRVVEGVAVLGVNGALVHRSKLDMADSTFLLGYNDMAADLEDAMAQADVHAVLSVYDTPGGEVQGAFEYAQRVFGFRGKKPMYSIADGMAASAGYLGASGADQVAVTNTGYAGSIGVVMRHVDFSRLLANDGVTVTQLFEGAHKVDGNPYEALPEAVRADFQAELKNLYDMFVNAVAQQRGMEQKAVRNTQARTYLGEAAVAVGLADRVATTDALITELAALRARSHSVGQSARSTADSKGASMSGTTTEAAGSSAANTAVLTEADVERARAEGRQQGAQAERDRVSGILGHQAAATHMSIAVSAITSGLSVEQASAILAAAPPPAPAAAGANAFAAAMGAQGNPKVSGIEAQGGNEGDEAALASSVLSNFRGAAK